MPTKQLDELARVIEQAKVAGPFNLLVGEMVVNTSVSFGALIDPIRHAIAENPTKPVWVRTPGGRTVYRREPKA